jgi:GNAT superfamily N-acetyltransferase
MIHADLELARRLEAGEAAIARGCTEGRPETAILEAAGGLAVFAGSESPSTQAIGIGLLGPVPRAELDRLESFFRRRGAKVSIDLCPLADPGLLEQLSARGYRPAEFNNAMIRRLAGAEVSPPVEAPAMAARARQTRPNEAELWCRTVGLGYFEQPELSEEEMDVGRAICSMPGACCYLAFAENGEACAGGAMAVRQSLATLFADSTMALYRRRGSHRDLIAARLSEALARGCDLATATVSPGSASQRNYERAGFQVAYTKILLVL